MSDTVLKIIPTDPNYTCDENTRHEIISFLSNIFSTQQFEIVISDSVEFIDQGGNFESVSCNLCGREFEIEYWQNQIEIASKTKFSILSFETSCCKKRTNLNALNYNWSAGFARFVVCISNPETELETNEVSKLITLIGCDIRIIWAKY